MNTRDFLELVMPASGIIFTASPATKGWYNVSHNSLDKAVEHINLLTFQHRAAYFAPATFKAARVWDASSQKWRYRTQENTQDIRAFFIDLDVDPTVAERFASKQDALDDLFAMVAKLALPRPLVVDSGGGIHAYWPLALSVPTSVWRPVADMLKAVCIHERLRADRAVTSDQARVLRAPGSFNIKRGAPTRVIDLGDAPTTFGHIQAILQAYIDTQGVGVPRGSPPSTLGAPPADALGDNLGATNDPLHFDRIAFSCAQIGAQVATRGRGVGEQMWRAALSIVKFCEPAEPAWRAVSDGHPDFDEEKTLQKIANWHTGPAVCAHFHTLNPSVCERCPHYEKITSPAQLGRVPRAAPAPTATVQTESGPIQVMVPEPPSGYTRRKDGSIVMSIEDSDGRPTVILISPYDIYPLNIRCQNGEDAAINEVSWWRTHLPITKGGAMEPRDFELPLSMMSDTRALSKYLHSKGIILNGEQAKMTQHYMSAYLQKLAAEVGREEMYERLGWHDKHRAFVLGDKVLYRDGRAASYDMPESVRNVTKNALRTAGSLEGWVQAMEFYNKPGYEGQRFFVYCALAAPLFHMNDTGNKGVLVTASGESGRGKTTTLKACGSIWGDPDDLIYNGNKDGATINALYSALGTMHSLPFLWDDTTERSVDELRPFMLNISQGQGKRRMTADSTMSHRLSTWETIVLTTTNSDLISAIMGTGADVNPHLMRMVNIGFGRIDTSAEAKIQADNFIRALKQNYGHVGPAFMKVVVPHYDRIAAGYIKNVAMVDRLLGSANASAERYWSATIAAAYTAAQVATSMGILRYPYKEDLQWMMRHVQRQRETIREGEMTPVERIIDFINGHLRNTLVVSAKAASNLDNVAHRPTDDLLIRHERDNGWIFVSRTALMRHCSEHRVSFREWEQRLEREGVIVQRNAQKVLGADTVFSNGQTRCWKLDGGKLGGAVATATLPGAASNVVAIGARA